MKKQYFIRALLIFSVFLCLPVAVCGQNDSLSRLPVSLRRTFAPEPVAPFRDTLFYISAGIGSFTPKERAASITEKIRTVSIKEFFHTDSLTILEEGSLLYVAYGNDIIMTITEADAQLQEKTQSALALEYEKIIRNAIVDHIKGPGWLTILFRVVSILLIIGVQYFVIKIINYLFRKFFAWIEQLKGTKIKSIKIKSYKLMDEAKATSAILMLFKILRGLIIFLSLYLSVPLALSVFPATRGLANVLFSYVTNPIKRIFSNVIDFVPDLFAIVVIILIFRYLIKGIRFMTEEIHKKRLTIKGFYPDWARPTFHIVRTLLYAFMFVCIWPYLPFSNSAVFQGVSVFIGVMFTLGSTSIIGNMVSGLVLTYMRPFKIGDRIKIGDLVGNVVEKTPLVTRIRTPKNEEVTIPNSNIMSAQTYNYSESARVYGLILHTTAGVGYETPWRQVHELLLEAAARTPNLLKKQKPFILQTALDDFYVNYQLNVFTEDADKMALIYSDLHQNMQDVFNEAGVELLSPHYHTHRDGNQSTLPESYLPADYKAPPFRVKMEK